MKDDPKASRDDVDISRWIDDVPKVVFSRTLREVTWKNARLAKGVSICEEKRGKKPDTVKDFRRVLDRKDGVAVVPVLLTFAPHRSPWRCGERTTPFHRRLLLEVREHARNLQGRRVRPVRELVGSKHLDQ